MSGDPFRTSRHMPGRGILRGRLQQRSTGVHFGDGQDHLETEIKRDIGFRKVHPISTALVDSIEHIYSNLRVYGTVPIYWFIWTLY